MVAAVPSKSTNAYIAQEVVACMRGIGVLHGDLLMKSDPEPAIKSNLAEIGSPGGRWERQVRRGAEPIGGAAPATASQRGRSTAFASQHKFRGRRWQNDAE